MDMRKQALEDERRRREELEKRLQEETSRRQKLIEREVKLREKQRAQVGQEKKSFSQQKHVIFIGKKFELYVTFHFFAKSTSSCSCS